MPTKSSGQLFIVTGDFGAGKTTFCAQLIAQSRILGLKVGGVLSPAVFENGQKTGINAVDLSTGQQIGLATLRSPGDQSCGPQTQRWLFNPQGITWGNAVLQTAVPCDLLVVDELGPLEFEMKQGWVAGFSALDSGQYRAGVVVIRPSLLAPARQQWPAARLITLPAPPANIPDILSNRIIRPS